MKFLQCLSLGLAALLAGASAIPSPQPQYADGDLERRGLLKLPKLGGGSSSNKGGSGGGKDDKDGKDGKNTAPEPVTTRTAMYNKFVSAGMTEGTTYYFELKWPKPEAPDANADIEAARVAVGAKHYAFATGKIRRMEKRGTKTKAGTITLDFDGMYYELNRATDGKTAKGISTLSSANIVNAVVTRKGSTRKSDKNFKDNADDYFDEHPDFKPQEVNCKTFMDDMISYAS